MNNLHKGDDDDDDDDDKDKRSITKISCLGQTAKNFITVSGRHFPT
jgi:hypothetical protein